jgi:hypothetical protein
MQHFHLEPEHVCSICQSETQLAVYQCPAKCVFHLSCAAKYVSHCRENDQSPNCRQSASACVHVVPSIIKLQQLQQEIQDLKRVNFAIGQERDYYRFYWYFYNQGTETTNPVPVPKVQIQAGTEQAIEVSVRKPGFFARFRRSRESQI